MRSAILIQATYVWIPNDNNINTQQTIALLQAIPNGGKMWFRPAFLNQIVFCYYFVVAMIQEMYIILIFIAVKK
jgi:hypothetical protein